GRRLYRLGDKMNSFLAEEDVNSVADILPWLQEAIAHFYPGSDYAQSLDPELRARAVSWVFRPPRTGFEVRCPHCGAPHATSLFDELIFFTCTHCGFAYSGRMRERGETGLQILY